MYTAHYERSCAHAQSNVLCQNGSMKEWKDGRIAEWYIGLEWKNGMALFGFHRFLVRMRLLYSWVEKNFFFNIRIYTIADLKTKAVSYSGTPQNTLGTK